MKRKILALLLSVALVGGVMMGCAGDGNGGDVAPPADTADEAADDTGDEPAGDEPAEAGERPFEGVRLTLEAIYPEADQDGRWITELIAAYYEKTGAYIEYIFTENKAYQDRVMALVAGDNVSDIGFTWGGGFTSQFLDADMISFLDDDMAETITELSDAAVFRDEQGRIYAIAPHAWCMVLYYNTAVFEEHNLSVPGTWEELLEVSEALSAAGVTPIAVEALTGDGTGWIFDIIHYRIAGPQVIQDVFDGTGTFEEAMFVETAEWVQELAAAGAFAPDFAVDSYDDAKIRLLMGEAAMYFDGSYMVGGLDHLDAFGGMDNISATNFPALGISADNDNIVMGGTSDAFFINVRLEGRDREAAVGFLQFMFSAEQQAIMAETTNRLPINLYTELDPTQVLPLFNVISDIFTNPDNLVYNVTTNRAPNTVYQDILRAMFFTRIAGGTITPEDFLEEFVPIYENAMQE